MVQGAAARSRYVAENPSDYAASGGTGAGVRGLRKSRAIILGGSCWRKLRAVQIAPFLNDPASLNTSGRIVRMWRNW